MYFLIEVVALDKKGVSFIIDNEFLHNLIGEGHSGNWVFPLLILEQNKSRLSRIFGAAGF